MTDQPSSYEFDADGYTLPSVGNWYTTPSGVVREFATRPVKFSTLEESWEPAAYERVDACPYADVQRRMEAALKDIGPCISDKAREDILAHVDNICRLRVTIESILDRTDVVWRVRRKANLLTVRYGTGRIDRGLAAPIKYTSTHGDDGPSFALLLDTEATLMHLLTLAATQRGCFKAFNGDLAAISAAYDRYLQERRPASGTKTDKEQAA